MKKSSVIALVLQWLNSTEMFARPSRMLPGKWQLFEYYSEPGGQLVHVDEFQLKSENQSWRIELNVNGTSYQRTSIPVKFLDGIENCRWKFSGNFLKLIHPGNSGHSEEFQFAVDKGILKLLKKNRDGKIRFFGFFRKLDEHQ